uniref:Uncharacterized protein n=1 Tax=Junco hyemalis TaxID=40217 RepID=A0A8C5JB03_JUNHY
CRQRPSYHSHAGSAVLCFPGKSKGRDVTNSAPTALLDRHKGRHGQGQERQRTLQGHTVRRAMGVRINCNHEVCNGQCRSRCTTCNSTLLFRPKSADGLHSTVHLECETLEKKTLLY